MILKQSSFATTVLVGFLVQKQYHDHHTGIHDIYSSFIHGSLVCFIVSVFVRSGDSSKGFGA